MANNLIMYSIVKKNKKTSVKNATFFYKYILLKKEPFYIMRQRKEQPMYHYDAVTSDANLDTQHRTAKNLRFLRIAHTMSQEEVCKKIDISRSQYSCLENGTKEATFPQLYALSLLYHISFEYMISFDLSVEATDLLQKKIHSIESREFQKKFLALSPKNQLHITEELFQISTAAKGGKANEK